MYCMRCRGEKAENGVVKRCDIRASTRWDQLTALEIVEAARGGWARCCGENVEESNDRAIGPCTSFVLAPQQLGLIASALSVLLIAAGPVQFARIHLQCAENRQMRARDGLIEVTLGCPGSGA